MAAETWVGHTLRLSAFVKDVESIKKLLSQIEECAIEHIALLQNKIVDTIN